MIHHANALFPSVSAINISSDSLELQAPMNIIYCFCIDNLLGCLFKNGLLDLRMYMCIWSKKSLISFLNVSCLWTPTPNQCPECIEVVTLTILSPAYFLVLLVWVKINISLLSYLTWLFPNKLWNLDILVSSIIVFLYFFHFSNEPLTFSC